MRMHVRHLLVGLILALVASVPALAAESTFPVVTGEHWQRSTPQERKAFLVGAATIIELDHEVQGAKPARNSAIDAWAKGLSHFTFDQMEQAIDKWYAEHPNDLKRPVIEVMWVDLAKPNLPPGVGPARDVESNMPEPQPRPAKAKGGKVKISNP